MEPLDADCAGLEQPQCVSRWKLNFFGRSLLSANTKAVAATMLSAIISCQSMATRYAQKFRSATACFETRLWNRPFQNSPMALQNFRHTHRVTYAECTVGNHIYYARYLDLLEAARGEFFRALGIPLLQLQNTETIFPVVESHLRYKSPARYDDLLTIEVWPTRLQGVRINCGARILNQNGTLLLEGETFHVCTGLNEKPKRVPENILEKLKPFLREAGDERIVS